jgi:hypothetical protein
VIGVNIGKLAFALRIGALLAFVSSPASVAADGVGAPQLAIGDHWQYRVTDNLRRGTVSELDVEVVSISGRTARIRMRRTDAQGSSEWFDELDGQGGLVSGSLNGEPARGFNPAVKMLSFPLDKGKTWRQTINTVRKDGIKDQILIYGRVRGSASVNVPAGSFDTVSIYRTVQLDDMEFWRTRTTRTDSVWYAPAAKAPVKETHEAQYAERGDRTQAIVRTESTVLELVSFQPGRP